MIDVYKSEVSDEDGADSPPADTVSKRTWGTFTSCCNMAISPRILRRYAAQGAEPVDPSLGELERMNIKYVTGDIAQQEGVVRHDQTRLARLLLDTFVKRRTIR